MHALLHRNDYIGMTFFVVIGVGSAMGLAKEDGMAWVLQVALIFGLAITALPIPSARTVVGT